MIQTTLLKRCVAELEASLQEVTKKKRRSKKRLQPTERLTVGEAQEMIARTDLLAKIAAEQRSQQPRSRAPYACSNCHQIGHTKRRCVGWPLSLSLQKRLVLFALGKKEIYRYISLLPHLDIEIQFSSLFPLDADSVHQHKPGPE